MAALGSEDWRNAIHAGVFSDGADRPSVPELPLLRETPRAKVRARVLDSLVERVRDVCREYSQRGAPRTHDSAGETPPARACAARSRLLLLRGVPDHKTGAVGSRCIATSRWLPDVAMHRAEATTAPRDHPVVPCPFPHLSLPGTSRFCEAGDGGGCGRGTFFVVEEYCGIRYQTDVTKPPLTICETTIWRERERTHKQTPSRRPVRSSRAIRLACAMNPTRSSD